MKSLKLVLVFLLVATFSFSQTIPQNSKLAMYVESGGKGIKFGILAYTDVKYRKFVAVESREINIGLSRAIQSTGNIDSKDIQSAASGIYDVYTQIMEKYKPLGLRDENVFFYTSSGLGVAKNIDALQSAIKEKVKHNVYVVKENEEAKYTIAGTIPYEDIDAAFVADQGGSNTKGGYVIKEGNSLTAIPVVFDLGSVRVAELVTSYMTVKPDDDAEYRAEFIRAMNKCFDSLKVVIKGVFSNIDGVENREKLFLSGGAAFVITTLLYPEADLKKQMVSINVKDLKSFLSDVQDRDAYNAIKKKTFEDAEKMSNYKKALTIYKQEQLISATKLLLTYVNALGGDEKQIFFNRYGLHSMPSMLMGRVLRGDIPRW